MRTWSALVGFLVGVLPGVAANGQVAGGGEVGAVSARPARRSPTMAPEVIDGLLEQSYITFFGGIAGNGPNLIFEGNIAPPFYITAANRLLIVGTPKVVLRMLDTSSRPVRTPSYMPKLAVFLRLFGNQFLTVSATHHSNGQEGSTFNADGTLNLRTGNFSTTYVEGALQGAVVPRAASGTIFGYRLGYEYHPTEWTDIDLRGIYPPRRVRASFEQIFQVSTGMVRLLGGEIRLTEDLTWYAGGEVPRTRYGPSRMGGWYSVSFKPSWLDELTLFMNGYVGPDYYNIHFLERLSVLRIGIGTRRRSAPVGPAIRTPG
jgi:hypothetical protein